MQFIHCILDLFENRTTIYNNISQTYICILITITKISNVRKKYKLSITMKQKKKKKCLPGRKKRVVFLSKLEIIRPSLQSSLSNKNYNDLSIKKNVKLTLKNLADNLTSKYTYKFSCCKEPFFHCY